ncbi:hypothetical protein B0F90DRAFT_1811039 [Multifurca ochricompacta]|uniref:Chalcone isomerase domain-containing protein n=1 Tax=Multifurca ochricompacta TaxID=376703 RepID=A0AAD4M0K9_9AGAM|nr:hypothetical protein B0F90DRAFT_1811039 [Multifurca ochricompacta]
MTARSVGYLLHRTASRLRVDDRLATSCVSVCIDPATSIEFPTILQIPSKGALPEFTLIGVGVRVVSFLKIKVYSVAFYADLSNPNLKIPPSTSPEEKVKYFIRNTAYTLRITPISQVKTMFPNVPFTKDTPLDIVLTSPDPKKPRALIIRDLGAIQNEWVAREFVLLYFDGQGNSPALKQSVFDRVAQL